jgi:glucuronate isomerase
MKFMAGNFLLHNRRAQRLYRQFAEAEPIFDFHCHLSPKDIADNRRFRNLFEIWLEGDHYKWRAMRANGVGEEFCTGAAGPFEKFRAWAATVPHTLRNPLYSWTHLELKRYFGINELLNEKSAARIWRKANEQLAGPKLTARGILQKFNVTALCTTDDPTDDLAHHQRINADGLATRVFPAFRPDKALAVNQPAVFNAWIARLEEAANQDIATLGDCVAALRQRHDYFHAQGCRLSDHGLSQCPASPCPERKAAAIFARARGGKPVSPEEHAQFATTLMLHFGRWDAEKGWVKQLHLGALRNNNSRFLKQIGPDTGFDCIGDFPQAGALVRYLDLLAGEGRLPKIIIYNSNPADNYVFSTIAGSFQDGTGPGKIQAGSGWWFLDQREGIEWQLNALSNLGLLSRFVGMVTDSRSFMSYPRHEYFRRVLCNIIGQEAERGDLPDDEALLGTMIRNICSRNARHYLDLPEIVRGQSAEQRNGVARRPQGSPDTARPMVFR